MLRRSAARKENYSINKSKPVVPTLSKRSTVHTLAFYSFKISLNILFPSTPRFSVLFLLFRFSDQSISHTSHVCYLYSRCDSFWFQHPKKLGEEQIQGVRMRGIQNKTIISHKAFIIHVYGLYHYKGKVSKFLSVYIIFSIDFNVGFLGGITNIQTIFDLVPGCLKHVWCYRSHSVPYVDFQVLTVVDLNLVDNVLNIAPQ
jgi:hypothetical protein